MKLYKKIFSFLFFFSVSIAVLGQDGNKAVNLEDTMRSNGRIYVVVAVMLTILIGLLLYMMRVDRKISKLEKETKQ